MMPVLEWLRSKAPSFARLTADEQRAIADFSLLWSLFESQLLNTAASARTICDTVQEWHDAGTLDAVPFDPELTYFQQRYYSNSRFTHYFDALLLRGHDREDLIRGVIDSNDNDPRHRMATVLLIVFRYRNNLFHGVKWQYELAGQLDNFVAANAVLMKVLEQHGTLAKP